MSVQPDISIEEYFRRKGGIGVLAALYDGDKPFGEILRYTHITESTLTVRLDEAAELGFVKQSRGEWKGRRRSIYWLSEYGDAIARTFARNTVFDHYEAMRRHQREISEGRRRVLEDIYQNPANYFMFPEANEGTFIVPEEGSEDIAAEGGKTIAERLEETEQATLDVEHFEGDDEDERDREQFKEEMMETEGGGPDPPELGEDDSG